MDYTVPEAVIKLRQGFGRLIRSASDFGTVIILDTRIIKKIYGRIFLESLPLPAKILSSEDELWEELLHWYQSAGRMK
jgi:ATP-dependent DNA helicase DinG